MSAATVVSGLFAFLWALDTLRLRARAAALPVLANSEAPPNPDHVFLVRTGATLGESTKRAASAYATAEGLEVLDLVPARLPAWSAMTFLHSADIGHVRAHRLAPGRTAGEAIVVHRTVLERMKYVGPPPEDGPAFAAFAARLKQYACTSTDHALAPGLQASPMPFRARGLLLESVFGAFALPIIVVQLALAGSVPLFAPVAGTLALAILSFQCFLATVGTPLSPKGRTVYSLFRVPIDFASALTWIRKGEGTARARAAEVRPEYDGLLAAGTAHFFEARRLDCPVCKGTELTTAISTTDHYQFKPGRFTLERCADCHHVFQNPRLSLDGLAFYYRDFYDGLGEGTLDGLFGAGGAPYIARAKTLRGVATPQRWLDVGAGHGHFCCVARDVWPTTRFDGLDLADSIDEAVQRRWIDEGYRGLFPDLAPALRDGPRYDVVSMSHYLEHTRDPEAEIAAAAEVLPPGGHLLIEVPDPDSRLGRLLGSYWMPWFQPQHQHLLSARNLEQLLRDHDFEPVVWHRGEAHLPADFLFYVFQLLRRVALPVDIPWRKPRPGAPAVWRAWHNLVWCLGIPLLALSALADWFMAPLFRREGWSNAYRVLARRAEGGRFSPIPAR